jgi:hypothetical protein
VPAGAASAFQLATYWPARPAWAAVGTSGRAGLH